MVSQHSNIGEHYIQPCVNISYYVTLGDEEVQEEYNIFVSVILVSEINEIVKVPHLSWSEPGLASQYNCSGF